MVLEERSVTAEEKEAYDAFLSLSGRHLEDYDYYYHVQTEEQGKKLEEIAARYGLVLRGDSETLLGMTKDYYALYGKPDWMGNELYQQELQDETSGLPTDKLLEALGEHCCRGTLFLTPPPYVDHLYWYADGTFAVDFTWKTESGGLANCYLYNSMYGTLSSGTELFDEIEDVTAYTARPYQTADGVEVTIMESPHTNAWGWHDDSYIFVYLEDSFLVVHVHREEGLTGPELETIADSIRYSAVNK